MLKRTLIVLVLMAFGLAACQSQATPSGTETGTPELQAYATQSDLAAEASPVPAKTESSVPTPTGETAAVTAAVANCTVVSRAPTPGPTEESLFPPPGDSDWVVGPETAAMTVYEYSDFQ